MRRYLLTKIGEQVVRGVNLPRPIKFQIHGRLTQRFKQIRIDDGDLLALHVKKHYQI